ncbi:hypothetical protein [Ferruginibacter profundus]
MIRYIGNACLFFTLLGCNQTNKYPAIAVKDSLPVADTLHAAPTRPVEYADGKSPDWANELIMEYERKNNLVLVNAGNKDTAFIPWILDSRLATDSAQFLIFQIGHTNSENFYAIDRWLYIDSVSKNMYDYDLPNEQLIKWSAKKNN